MAQTLNDILCRDLEIVANKSTKRMLYIWRMEAILKTILSHGVITPELRADAEKAFVYGKGLNGSEE